MTQIILAWAATLAVLVTYAFLGRTGRATPFHVANVVGSMILAPINLAAGTLPQAALNVVFGGVAACSLVRAISHRRQLRRRVPENVRFS